MRKLMPIACFVVGVTALAAPASSQLANPGAWETQQARNNPCSDPWVSLAVQRVKGSRAAGSGNSGECDIKLYNNASWGSYNELVGHVQATRSALASQNVQFVLRGGAPALAMINPRAGIAAANIVAAGGGNIVAAGGGNIVAAGAGNIVAAGGGNFSLKSAEGYRMAFRLPGGGQLRAR